MTYVTIDSKRQQPERDLCILRPKLRPLNHDDMQITKADDDEMTDEENEAYYKETYFDTACLFEYEDSNLARADDIDFKFPENSIYFIETSCRGGLDMRQACSVETAARAHPNRQINVLFAGRSTTKDKTRQKYLNKLLKYKNVKFYKIHLFQYARGTPLEDLAVDGLRKSRYLIHHASDILRFITLYKFGGIYLDLDVFVVKSLDHMPIKKNWIGRDSDSGLAVALIAFAKTGVGKELIDEIMTNLKKYFSPNEWGSNGIGVTTKAIMDVCSNDWRNVKPANCRGFKIYDPEYFYPVKSADYEKFMEPLKGTLNLTNVYAFHLWNYLLYGDHIPGDSLHAVLSKKYCPKIHKASGNPGYYCDYSIRLPPIRTIRIERSQPNSLHQIIKINSNEDENPTQKYIRNLAKILSSITPERYRKHHRILRRSSLVHRKHVCH
ncbi:alpha 1,4-glycosyltransferase conserved region domain-containing protein [Phthorimaea operculella]|nr:alpha 1,4-glycosyltransferase conserved region domain-containing protein [Phthorimaea operculella]